MIIVKTQGGLGNQLFQYAAALQLSTILKSTLYLDTSYFKEEKFKDHFRLDKFKIEYSETNIEFDNSKEIFLTNKIRYYIFRNTSLLSNPGLNEINGDSLKYPISSLIRLKKNVNFLVYGWLQKSSYFSQVSNILSDNLWLKDIELVNRDIAKRISESNSVAVHVRRGDMAINPNFVTLERDYYFNAIRKVLELTSDPLFFVFSDEPEKAMGLFKGLNIQIIFITENSQSLGFYGTQGDYIDFELMRQCKHFIISNSTFSWWPAYLSNNTNKIVVAPKIWYKNKCLQNNFENSGLLLHNWTKM